MPRFDGTGPFGEGPMTGRGAGSCGNPNWRAPRASLSYRWGGGLGFGPRAWSRAATGRGRGMRFWGFRAAGDYGPAGFGPTSQRTLDPDQEISLLQDEAERLRSMLEDVERRLRDLQDK